MRVFKVLCFIALLSLVVGCNHSSKKDEMTSSDESIDELIKSNNPDKMVNGFYLIGEKKMTEYIPEIFQRIDDPRISHHINFKGISVYQSKVTALSKISRLEPPRKITYKPDTVVVNFYYKWAREKGFLKTDR